LRLGYVKASINTDLVSDFDKNNLLSILFNNLKSMGFIPKHIVDGANHGTWTREDNSFSGCLLHFAGTSKLVKKSFQDILDAILK
jgi:hypothetical protein